MVSSKIIISALVFVMIIGLSLTGTGITGMVVYNPDAPYVGELCSSDASCEDGKTCCVFYGETEGICHEEDICDQVTLITMVTENNGQENILVSQNQKNELNNEKFNILYYKEFALGILIIALVVAALYFFLRYHPYPVEQHTKKSRGKIKSKSRA